jgi:nucleotide-binding universal stress UspA family protein
MFRKVLLPLDGSPLAECVLPHALALAQAFDAHITLLRVLEPYGPEDQVNPIDPLEWRIRRAEADAYLDAVAARLRDADVGLQIERVLLEGQSAERIVEFAQGCDADLIILSSHGRTGLSGWNVSSVVQKIIQRIHLSIMIVRAYQPIVSDLTALRYRRLLVPLDGSQRAECALFAATTLATAHQAEMAIVQVVSKPETPRRTPLAEEDLELVERLTERNRQAATKYMEQLRSRLLVDFEPQVLVSDDVATSLHEQIQTDHIDLVVLSAHGQSGKTRWPYGSVTTSFIIYGTTPLLIVQDLSPHEVEASEAEMAAEEYKGH